MTKRTTIRIDPIMCDGQGCAPSCCPSTSASTTGATRSSTPSRSAPELVKLARRAEAACPTLALLLETRRDRAR